MNDPVAGVNTYKLLTVLALLLASPGFCPQSTAQGGEQGRLLALENAWNQAVQQKDATALEMLLGPELVYVDYDGTLMDRAAYLLSVQAETLKPARAASESMIVHLYGAVAVVNGVYRENGVRRGKPYVIQERFTDTWVRKGEGWVCVASHATSIQP